MRIYISSDMEGTAGVVDWSHCIPGRPDYDYYVSLLTEEINAAISGAIDAGVSEFLVNDAHSRMANLRPGSLAGRARYLSGRLKPMYMMQGLDASFDGVFLISYHGSAGTGSALSHTYFPAAFAEVRLNGVVAGEAGINCLVAQAYDVPVLLVTGDRVTAEETRRFCPDVNAAVVKESVSRFAAESLHPSSACELIRDQARSAVSSLSARRPPQFKLPVTMRVRFRSDDYAELASRVHGVTRETDLWVSMLHEDPLTLYQTFVTVVLLCRGLQDD